jgi:hypothetical protein
MLPDYKPDTGLVHSETNVEVITGISSAAFKGLSRPEITCKDWTSGSASDGMTIGFGNLADIPAVSGYLSHCDEARPVYCLED